MVIGIDLNSFGSIGIEVLKIGQNNLDLVEKEVGVDIDPALYFDFKRIS
jgi:hypothetical protein